MRGVLEPPIRRPSITDRHVEVGAEDGGRLRKAAARANTEVPEAAYLNG